MGTTLFNPALTFEVCVVTFIIIIVLILISICIIYYLNIKTIFSPWILLFFTLEMCQTILDHPAYFNFRICLNFKIMAFLKCGIGSKFLSWCTWSALCSDECGMYTTLPLFYVGPLLWYALFRLVLTMIPMYLREKWEKLTGTFSVKLKKKNDMKLLLTNYFSYLKEK